MAIRIVCDSGADVADLEHKALSVVPLSVIFGNDVYLDDGIQIDHKRFFEMLTDPNAVPKTGQVTPYQFDQVFKQATEAGEQLIVITISSRLSGTYESAISAAQPYDSDIAIIDSLNASLGIRVLVEYGLQLIDKGMLFDEVAAALRERVSQLRVVAVLDTLEFLKRGGRLLKAAAMVGILLSIKPVITAKNGAVSLIGKARGSKNANKVFNQMIEKRGGIDFSLPFALGYTGLDMSITTKYMDESRDLYAQATQDVVFHSMGPTIGTHAGPGTIAIGFFAKDPSEG